MKSKLFPSKILVRGTKVFALALAISASADPKDTKPMGKFERFCGAWLKTKVVADAGHVADRTAGTETPVSMGSASTTASVQMTQGEFDQLNRKIKRFQEIKAEKLSPEARSVLVSVDVEADRYSSYPSPASVVKAVSRRADMKELFEKAGVDPQQVKNRMESLITSLRGSRSNPRAQAPIVDLLIKAEEIATDRQHDFILPEDLLLAAAQEDDVADNDVQTALTGLKLTRDKLTAALELRDGIIPGSVPASISSFVKRMVADGDPVIGRKDEIREVLGILGRRKKANPVLTGDGGAGKTTVVEGIVQMIDGHDANLPPHLADKIVWTFDVMAFESVPAHQRAERLRQFFIEVKKRPNVIVWIDELKSIVQGEKSGENNIADAFKINLTTDWFRNIGATTFDEFDTHIAVNGPLSRRYEQVKIYPTNRAETLAIIQRLQRIYAKHHQIRMTPDVAEAIVDASSQAYIKVQPDAALTLMDDVLSSHRVGLSYNDATRGLVAEKYELERLFAEKMAEAREVMGKDPARFRDLQAEIHHLDDRRDEIFARPDFEISAKDVYEKVRKQTGYFVGPESANRDFAKERAGSVPGQQKAFELIQDEIRNQRKGFTDPNKTQSKGAFLFYGLEGSGMTETALELANFNFPDGGGEIVVIDGKQYSNETASNLLFAVPPGYIGYGPPGRIYDINRRNPKAVLVFKNLGFFFPGVQGKIEELMETGQTVTNTGLTIDRRNNYTVAIQNIPKTVFKDEEASDNGTKVETFLDDAVPHNFLRVLRPIPFKLLTREDQEQMVAAAIEKANATEFLRPGVHVTVNTGAISFLILKAGGEDATFQSIKDTVKRWVIDGVSRLYDEPSTGIVRGSVVDLSTRLDEVKGVQLLYEPRIEKAP